MAILDKHAGVNAQLCERHRALTCMPQREAMRSEGCVPKGRTSSLVIGML